MTCNKFWFFYCFFILLFGYAKGQAQFVELHGTVLSEKNEPLQYSTIKVSRKTNTALIVYSNTGEVNSFDFKIKWEKADTLLITASFTGYKTKTIAVAVNNPGKYTLEFTLNIGVKELEEVIVKEIPPVWKRGDTTFYNPDAFKEPGNRKLGDIISQLPGFRINETGELLYKNNKIAKITIDGEDLFADKIQLLLKNFPLHVINNIQALEKQNANKKLKGLSGDYDVTVNISIKKDKLNILFGDAEAGVGTKGRYLINPVLFKLLPGVKTGFISNINSYGQSPGYQEDAQLKGSAFMDAANGMVSNRGIAIPDFSTSRYVQNNFIDTRLQVSIPVNKNLKSNTEFSFVKDKQQQRSNTLSSIYSDSIFIESKSNQHLENIPSYFHLSQKLDWDINQKTTLNAIILLAKDKTKYREENEIFQNNTPYNTISQIENNWSSLTIKLDYTKRVNATRAIQSQAEYGYFYFPQFIAGISDSWKTLFNLPDSAYKNLQQPYLSKTTFFKSTTTRFLKIKKRVITYNLHASWISSRLNSQLDLKTFGSALPIINIPSFSGNGQYDIKTLSTDFGYGFRAFKIPFTLNAVAGVSYSTIKEQNKRQNYLQPVISVTIRQKHVFNKKITSHAEISYNSSTQNIYSLHTNIYPTGIAQFSNYSNTQVPEQSLSFSNFLLFQFKNYATLSFSPYCSFNFPGHLNQPSYTGILGINTDSIVSGSNTVSYFINGEYSFPIVALGTKVTISNNLSLSNGLIYIDKKIKKSEYFSNKFQLQIKRNWNKKIFLTILSRLETFNVKLPDTLQGQSFSKTTNLISKLALRGTISKTLSGTLSVEHIQNTLSGNNKSTGFFADAEVIKTFTKNKLSLRLKLENIFNQKEYLVVNRYSPLYQSFYKVPLIGSNIFFAMRIEL